MKIQNMHRWILVVIGLLMLGSLNVLAEQKTAEQTEWTWAGWGGGGFYYAAVFHPTKDGVIYLGGDVLGCYKSEDHGRTWRMINNGIASYGVFSMAVDPNNPETVYAATTEGLCKSTDGGENWKLLPNTGRNDLRITGEKKRSVRSIAVHPTNGDIIYAASPIGIVYKSKDGGYTWNAVYEEKPDPEIAKSLTVQYGKSSGDWYGGIWLPIKFPSNADASSCIGLGLNFKGDGNPPRNAHVKIQTTSGATYVSRDLREIFQNDQWQQVVLTDQDFTLDPQYIKKHPGKAAAQPATPDWSTVKRLDIGCVGSLPTDASVAKIADIFFAFSKPQDQDASADRPTHLVVRNFADNKSIRSYGNVRIVKPPRLGIYSVAVVEKNPSLVAAAASSGLVMSKDAGQTWQALNTPARASSVVFAKNNPKIMYASFHADGLARSVDGGKTWKNITPSTDQVVTYIEIAASPTNPNNVYAIGKIGWDGEFFYSNNGGQSWTRSSSMRVDDLSGNPTLPGEIVQGMTALSNPRNLAINPNNPQELFIAANWRLPISQDGGKTWTERSRGADISCITDIRFRNGRTYVTAMDIGTLVSDDDGKSWKELWPLKYDEKISGHNWRVAVNDNGQGGDRIIATCSPWDNKYPNRIIRSDDGGKTYEIITKGLPDYVPTANTMWGKSYLRALTVDPNNSDIIYAGMDGDPTQGRSGGGIFKSVDGGKSWSKLPNQPNSRRIFFGLAVDPTDSNRIYMGAGGRGAGLYRSEDAGNSWERVFSRDGWVFNLHVTADGTLYCLGKNLWQSKDHGKTWKKLTSFSSSSRRVLVGIEVDPDDPDTIWISQNNWSLKADGAVWKTTDGGDTWADITSNLPYVKPLILRFNPDTRELWTGFVGLYKIKQ